MNKQTLVFIVIFLILILASGGFIIWQKPFPQISSFFKSSFVSQINKSITPPQQIPSAYKIENIPYTYGYTSCCYCTGMTAMMAYRGVSKEIVENYWQDIKATNYQEDPVIFIRLLSKYGLNDKLHVAWLNPNNATPKFEMLWKKYLASYQNQVHFFKTEEEALSTLKQLISQNIPVMVAYEEDPRGTYNLVYGYDEQKVYYWTLPANQTSDSIEKFLTMWRMQQEEFPYPNFPGHYTMMWLEPSQSTSSQISSNNEILQTLESHLHNPQSGTEAKKLVPDLVKIYTDDGHGNKNFPQQILPFTYYYSPKLDITISICNIDQTVFICSEKLDRLIQKSDFPNCQVTPIYLQIEQ